MAKPIRAIPELKGQEADEFLRKMIRLERTKINSRQKRLAQEIQRNVSLLTIA